MSAPYFSIIIPVWNRLNLIRDCIYSCIEQRFENFEVMIVDDASIDGSFSLIEEIAKCDNRIRCYRLTKNSGVSVSRNFACSHAKGKWFIYLDSDDKLSSNILEDIFQSIQCTGYYARAFGFASACNNNTVVMPVPLPSKEIAYLSFGQYLDWYAKAIRYDFLPVYHVETWEKFPWPHNRALESYTTMKIVHSFGLVFVPIIAQIVGESAGNKIMNSIPGIEIQKDRFEYAKKLRVELGAHIKELSPPAYWKLSCNYVSQCFLSKNRIEGVLIMLRCIINNPFDIQRLVYWFGLIISPSFGIYIKRFASYFKLRKDATKIF